MMKAFFSDGCKSLPKAKNTCRDYLKVKENGPSEEIRCVLWVVGAGWDFDSCNIQQFDEHWILRFSHLHLYVWINDGSYFAPVRIFHFSHLYEILYEDCRLGLCCLWALSPLSLLHRTFLTPSTWREVNLPRSTFLPFRAVHLSEHVGAFQIRGGAPVGWSQSVCCRLPSIAAALEFDVCCQKHCERDAGNTDSVSYCTWPSPF